MGKTVDGVSVYFPCPEFFICAPCHEVDKHLFAYKVLITYVVKAIYIANLLFVVYLSIVTHKMH